MNFNNSIFNGNYRWIVSIFFCCILFLISIVSRTNFLAFISLIFCSFFAYYWIIKARKDEKFLKKLTILVYFVGFFSIPNLSNDIYRFLWDGELLHVGLNPYDFLPNEIIHFSVFRNSKLLSNLYPFIDPLSQENYSCYPVVNQAYFYLSTCFSNSIYINILVCRLLILITLFAGFHYLGKILKMNGISQSKKWLFILNPLVIVEVGQNLHFEGVMLSFLLIAFYHIQKNNWLLAALFFSFAIHIKLIPLIILPFILRWIGWKKSIAIWLATFCLTGLLALILLNEENVFNFLKSIQLYFRQFEFNSLILHWYIEYGKERYGYNRIQTFAPYLSRIATELIILLAWLGDNFSFKGLATRLLFAFFAYYLLSSTIHPWYLLTPLIFSVFTNFKFLILWSATVFLSYYSYLENSGTVLRSLHMVEYGIVLGYLVYEIYVFWRKFKAKKHTIF